jgi:hypothetical protein
MAELCSHRAPDGCIDHTLSLRGPNGTIYPHYVYHPKKQRFYHFTGATKASGKAQPYDPEPEAYAEYTCDEGAFIIYADSSPAAQAYVQWLPAPLAVRV